MRWITAVAIWNRQMHETNTDHSWCSPRKGTPEYDEVAKIAAKDRHVEIVRERKIHPVKAKAKKPRKPRAPKAIEMEALTAPTPERSYGRGGRGPGMGLPGFVPPYVTRTRSMREGIPHPFSLSESGYDLIPLPTGTVSRPPSPPSAPESLAPVKPAGNMKKAIGQLIDFARKIEDENKKRRALAAISKFVGKVKARRAAKKAKVSEETKKDMRRFELRRMTGNQLRKLLSQKTGKPEGYYRQYKTFKTTKDLEDEVLRLEGLL